MVMDALMEVTVWIMEKIKRIREMNKIRINTSLTDLIVLHSYAHQPF